MVVFKLMDNRKIVYIFYPIDLDINYGYQDKLHCVVEALPIFSAVIHGPWVFNSNIVIGF